MCCVGRGALLLARPASSWGPSSISPAQDGRLSPPFPGARGADDAAAGWLPSACLEILSIPQLDRVSSKVLVQYFSSFPCCFLP